jgi:hypothetical protein
MGRRESNDAAVHVAYCGEAVADGTMEIREIAPALQAISDLIYEANVRLNGDRATISVKVSSEFRRGSFETQIAVEQFFKAGQDFLLSEGFHAAQNLLGLLGFLGGSFLGLLQVLKMFRGEKAKREELPSGQIRLYLSADKVEFHEHREIIVPRELADLLEDPPVRRACREMLRPLERPGIDSFEIREDSKTIESVHEDDLASFTVPAEPILEENTREFETLLVIESLAFRDSLSWRFSDGSGPSFAAKISDYDFLQQVEAGRAFSKGQALRVRMRVSQTLSTLGKLTSEREIIRVIDVISAPRQSRMKY